MFRGNVCVFNVKIPLSVDDCMLRLHLQGLLPTAEYELSEPLPNNMMQQKGNLRIIETESKFRCYANYMVISIIAPVYQLEYAKVILTGAILMKAGLPST